MSDITCGDYVEQLLEEADAVLVTLEEFSDHGTEDLTQEQRQSLLDDLENLVFELDNFCGRLKRQRVQ